MKRPATTADSRLVAGGVVCDGEVYRLQELKKRLGWGEHAVRQARVGGLRLIVFGREKYVLGRDVLDFFAKLGERQTGGDQAKEEP